jgi:DNA repair protein RadA/Sms
VVIGELGLSGEVRFVPNLEKRIKEAEKLGFKKVICPKNKSIDKFSGGAGSRSAGKIEVAQVKSLGEAIKLI